MSDVGFPQLSVRPTDPNGNWTREWLLFLQALWMRGGGTTGQSTTELVADLPEDAGIEEMRSDLFSLRNESGSDPPMTQSSEYEDQAPIGAFFIPDENSSSSRLEALEAVVQSMAKEIEALKQGITP